MATSLCRIVHLSDIHVGRLAFPKIDEALLQSVNAAAADLVVVTGDLVQRAHRWQYRRVVAFLAAIEAPLLVVPGNHDLYSWIYRPWMRVLAPLGRYRRMIGDDLSPAWAMSGVAVLGLNTATPWTIQRGRCKPAHARRITTFFAAYAPETVKILAVHHPLVDVDLPQERDVAQGAGYVLSAAAQAGVDMVLCGHWHLSFACRAQVRGRSLVMALAGTASSDRYRAPQVGLNAYNVVELYPARIGVQEWRYSPAAASFEAGEHRDFRRVSAQHGIASG